MRSPDFIPDEYLYGEDYPFMKSFERIAFLIMSTKNTNIKPVVLLRKPR